MTVRRSTNYSRRIILMLLREEINMNTPIYRAKSLDSGEYVEGFYFHAEIEKEHIIMKQVPYEKPWEYDNEEYEIDPSTLMISFDDGINWWKDLKMINDHLKRDLCSTMSRPKKECGCPDCGSSLIG